MPRSLDSDGQSESQNWTSLYWSCAQTECGSGTAPNWTSRCLSIHNLHFPPTSKPYGHYSYRSLCILSNVQINQLHQIRHHFQRSWFGVCSHWYQSDFDVFHWLLRNARTKSWVRCARRSPKNMSSVQILRSPSQDFGNFALVVKLQKVLWFHKLPFLSTQEA